MDLNKYFNGLNKLYTEPNILAAIWLEKPVNTSTGKTVRITEGQLICVKDNEIQTDGEFTHKVIGCYGTLINQFEISCIELETGLPTIIKI